jgi:hypothetical protein
MIWVCASIDPELSEVGSPLLDIVLGVMDPETEEASPTDTHESPSGCRNELGCIKAFAATCSFVSDLLQIFGLLSPFVDVLPGFPPSNPARGKELVELLVVATECDEECVCSLHVS